MILPCIIACSLIKNNYSWWPPSKVFMNEGQSCENQETVLKKNVILLMYVSKHYSICHYYNSWKSTIFLSQQQYYLVGTVPFFYLIWTLNSLHIIEWVQSMEPISGSEFDHARVTLWNSWLIRFWMCNWRNDRRSHDDDHHLSRKSHLKWKIRCICMYLLLLPHSQGAILSKIHSLIK